MQSFAVIFDLDGLMLDTERMARAAWIRALADYGMRLDEVAYLRVVGRSTRDSETQAILEEIFNAHLFYEDLVQRRQAYYDADIAENGIVIKPGLLELLAFLEERNIPKAVASSSGIRSVIARLERVGLAGQFEVLVGGDQVINCKPAPDLFLEAARQSGIAPGLCVALEDSEAGIRAAYSAGMLPMMVPDLKQPEPEIVALAYRVLPTLADAIPVLEGFLESGLPAG